MDNKSLSHTKWKCQYHIVFIPKYRILNAFLEKKNTYGYIAKEDDIIVGFAFGYVLIKPNGIKDFYLHAIDIMEEYQNHGYGTELVKYIVYSYK